MIRALTSALLPNKNEKLLKEYRKIVAAINVQGEHLRKLDDAQLSQQATQLRQQASNGQSLDSLLVDAFAVARETGHRVLGERLYDVQLLGSIALHQGKISEMKTGEGKTLCSTAAAFLNALSGKGVHIVTPNDYLAQRDSEWMGSMYQRLGLSVGLIQNSNTGDERRNAYAADITYGTNNEFGFDYLRDNMQYQVSSFVQRGHNYAIIDEVDSILIDEARTPLIISGPSEQSTDRYYTIQTIIRGLTREVRKRDLEHLAKPEQARFQKAPLEADEFYVLQQGDYLMDEKSRTINLTERGSNTIEQRINKKSKLIQGSLFDYENIEILHHVNQALKANYLFRRDVDYVVSDGKVIVVDEFTGRLMAGRRFGDGLHQALEAKEGVKIERESQTFATITFQNYFRMYNKLGGMTGTAKTEEDEFIKIYGAEVLVVPTNREIKRTDLPDSVFQTNAGKLKAVIKKIKEVNASGQPILVGTISIEVSESLSANLKKAGIKHTVLNAKYHEKEAEIVAQAGQRGQVTIATNMAGRGTDIKLGEGVNELGGLFILGTERHESRRIDNQLRGRAGRQGDNGTSQFYISLQDDLMRIFGGDRIRNIIGRLNVPEDEPIVSGMLSRSIEGAQRKVEAHHFEMRKHVLEYDDVMNNQRSIIYELRQSILMSNPEEVLLDMLDEVLEVIVSESCDDKNIDVWDTGSLLDQCQALFGLQVQFDFEDHHLDSQKLRQQAMEQLESHYQQRRSVFLEDLATSQDLSPEAASDAYQNLLRQIALSISDNLWKEHLLVMDNLREAVGLVGYAQKKPIDEYKREALRIFTTLVERISREVARTYFHIKIAAPIEQRERRLSSNLKFTSSQAETPQKGSTVSNAQKIGRNSPCYCGSGKKFKNCHMKDQHKTQTG